MRYLFGGYELNTATQELSQAGRLVQLTPKAYAVLVHLVVNRERLVSKEELLEEIWPDTYVDDSAVKRNIMAVRRALSSGSGASAPIKTQRARGYRFIAPVEVRAPEPDSVADVMAPASNVPAPVVLPPVPEPVKPPHQSQPVIAEVAERKLITALYCQVSRQVGQDGIADLDTLHDLMQTVYAYAYEEAQRYGGTVQYLTGEGGLILFGIPLALEDHARLAVLTAWALHRRLQRHGDRLTLQVALHTGLVVFTQLHEQPRDMAAVVGDVTTLAAAMVQRAPRGAIVASDTTVDLVPDVVHALPLSPMHIAGTDPEMPMYRITDVILEQPTTRRFITPFVGRDVEQAMLTARWQQAQKGRGQVVCIVGEPGIGKSRLLHEFRSMLTSSENNLIYRRCDGRSYSRATPYLPILALLRSLWAIADADHDEHLAAKVNTGLREAGLEADVLGPYFQSLLGGGTTPDGLAGLSADVLRTRIFDALHQFFLRGSGTDPWVLEIENAHWIDATSEAYFTSLVDRLVGLPVLMLVTFRPGYRPAWLDKSYVTQLAIPALGPDDSREIVAAILGEPDVDSAMRQQLLAKAEGNPFFLEELARAMAEPTHVKSGRVLPNTVHAVLAERIDRLAPAEKQLLQTAAVVGPEVPVRLLRAVASLSEDDLNRYLQRLQANEFLYETHLFPEPVYTFKHALTHEVAYATLLQSQRRQLHVCIVDALEDIDESERRVDRVEVLAHHAYGGARWEKACHYFIRAGVHAMARSAYREAATSYQQALQSLAHLPEKKSQREQAVDLRLMLHAALFRSGDPARSLAVLGEAQQIAEVLDDPYRLGWTASYLSTHYFMAGDLEGALSYGLRARALADVCEDERLQVDVRLHLGQAYHARGDYAAAIGTLAPNIDFVHRVLRHHAPEDAPIPGSHALPWMVLCLAETGDFEQGERCIEDAFKILAMGESPYEQVVAYGSAGWLKLRRGDVATALPLLEQAMSYCQTAGIVQMLPVVASFLGAAYLQSGRRPEAIALLEEAVAQATAMRVMVYHALSMVCLGQAYRLDGRLADARAQAEGAIVLAQTQKDQGHEAWAYHLLGETLAQDMASGTEMAEAAFRKALVRAETCGMRPLQAHCHLGLTRLYRHYDGNHQTTRAEAERTAAIALYRSLDMPFWLSFAESV